MDDVMEPLPSRLESLPSGNDSTRLIDAKNLGWNWAGFLLPYFWLIGHGRATLGFILLFSACVPFTWLFHLFLYPMTALYLGLNGFEIAWRSQPAHSIAQLREREREWIWWGAVYNLLLLGTAAVFLVYLRTVIDEVLWNLQGQGW
jgi:hypothetical protein